MNKTETPTVQKITFSLRLSPLTYKKLRAKVNEIKEKDNYAFSINEYITDLIENSLNKN
ncbi:MAG: hypothetical protein IKJ14_06055 [Clostridia bacterium]|nr:hypothetical protein [Clostridia bacterium]